MKNEELFKLVNMRVAIRVMVGFVVMLNIGLKAQTTMGTEFWVVFLENFSTSQLSLFISSDRNVTGTVTVPATGFVQNFNVPANGNIRINLPASVIGQAIHIVTSDTVSVWAANLEDFTSEITVVLPQQALGNQYVVMSHDLASIGDDVIGIIAVENGTQVEILMPGNTTPTVINMNRGDVHYIRGSSLTGTVIKSVYSSQGSCKPIAVFAGNTCGNICVNGTFKCCCDHIYEQMFPVESWGKRFYIVPLQTRANYIVRVAAFYNNTVVTANGAVVATLNQGQYWEGVFTQPVILETSEPTQVAQYSTSQDCDGVPADPFYIIIPPIEQTMKYVVFEAISTGAISSYYLNIVVPTASVNNTFLNGANIGATFTPFPNDPTYSYSIQILNTGTYILENPDGFIATIYGYGNYESYGYIAGSSAKSLVDFDVTALYSGANCPGDSVMITLEIVGNVNIVYHEWNLGDGTIKYGDTIYHVYSRPDTYTITLNYITGMNLCGSISKQIWIGPQPINNPLGIDTACFEQPITIYADTTVPPIYVWSTGDTASYITITPTQPEDTLILFYDGNCDIYDTLILKTSIIDRQYNLLPNLPLCYYDTISVDILMNATFPVANISISLDTGWLSCDTCQKFLAYHPDSFRAVITITDQVGCSVTDTLQFSVVKRLIPQVPDTSICEFEDTILVTPTFNFTRNPLQYQWTSLNAVVFCDTCPSTTLYVSDSTLLVLQVTDSFGCMYFDTAQINALPRPVFSIPDTDVCYRDTVVLRIPQSAGFPYNSIVVSPNQYLECDTCQTTQVFLPDTPITFAIFVENKWNCTWKDSITYNVSYPSFRYFVYPEPPLCYNETVNLKIYSTGNWLPYTYSLTASDSIIVACSTCEQTTITGLDTGQVIITVTDALGCSLSDTAHIPVLPELKVSVSDTAVCFGTPQVTLFPSVVNDLTELDYLWVVPNAEVDCATCSSLVLYPEETTPVLIFIRDTFGCEASDTALLKVLPAPRFTLNDTVICWHDTPTTAIQINHYIPYSIIWHANPDLIDCDTCLRINIYPVDYLSITATLTDTLGCSWQDSMIVFVDKGPELEILGDTVFLQGTPIQLELSTDAQRFFWLINNRPVAIDQYTFSLPSGLIQDSTYVMAYGYNDLGCRAYDTVLVRIVEVQCDKALFVPNAFTPNEDGLNDQFHIYTLNPFINIKRWEVRNQWGEILFQTSDVTFDNKGHSIQSWDGTFNGNKVPPDVYVYYVIYECEGKQLMKKGDVSILY